MVMKKCQIHATSPITCFTVPIVGTTELNLTPDEIYKCLCAKAEVMEILGNGKMINLDFSNYNRDNSIIGEPIEEVKEEQSEEKIVVIEEEEPEVVEEVKVDIDDRPETVFVTGTNIVEEIDEEVVEVEVAETVSTEEETIVIEAEPSAEVDAIEPVEEVKITTVSINDGGAINSSETESHVPSSKTYNNNNHYKNNNYKKNNHKKK